MNFLGQIPYIVFLSCPSVITSSLYTNHPLHNSSQILIKELHTERFSDSIIKKFKGVGTHSIRDIIIDLINNEFESVLSKTQDPKQAILAVESAAIVLSVFENSDKSEFKFSNLHSSVLELAKDLDGDAKVSKIVIICNCKNKQPIKDSQDYLIKQMKEKEGEVSYKYDFEVVDTDELIKDGEYNLLLTKH